MGIVLDLIILAIIIFFCLVSAKKGFVKTIVEAAGIIAAIIITFTISTPLANTTYDKIIEPPIIKSVAEETVGNTENAVQTVWDSMPDFITNNAERLSLDSEQLSKPLTDNTSSGVETAVRNVSQDVIKPVAVKILGLIYSVIIFVVLSVIVKFLAKLINKIFSFSIVGKANRILGGIIGIFKGAVIAVVFCMVISIIVSLTKNGFLIFTPDNINNSYVFKMLTEILPF